VYLVTGGAGFIGSHLCDALLRSGHRVVALDDLSTGSERNIAHLGDDPRFRLVVDSILNRTVVATLVGEVDAIFHLAGAVGVRLVVQQAVRTIETNVLGTAVVLEAASERSCPILLASSSEAYGKSSKTPFSETDDLVLGRTTVGRWAYGCSKALDEYLALAYARERSLHATVVRLFNTAGPRQSGQYGMVLPRFVRQALAGEPITVHGDGTQRRCFCDVRDVVDALPRLLAHPRSAGNVFNLGSDEQVTIDQLAHRVREATESPSPIVHVPYAEVWDDQFEDMQLRVPDLERVRNLIGFQPKTRLDQIIERVVAHERGALAAA